MHTLHPSPPRPGRVVLIGTAATALALLPALPAAAHDQLLAASPASGATVTTPPRTVDLTFSATPLELGGGRNSIEVTDAAGRHYETACARVDGPHLTVATALGAGGSYSVTWRAVSSDGHEVGDTYAFRYRPAAGAPAAAGAAESPCAGARDVVTTDRPAPVSGLPTGALVTGLVAGGVLVAAVVAVLVVLLRLRRADGVDAPKDQEGPR